MLNLIIVIVWAVAFSVGGFVAIDSALELTGHYAVVMKILLVIAVVLVGKFYIAYTKEPKKEYLQSMLCLMIVVFPFFLLGVDYRFIEVFEWAEWNKDMAGAVMTVGCVLAFVFAILMDNWHDRKYPQKK
ncbi:hypothetical protein SM033_00098 [Vibrio phage vB_VpaM_sm033]|nr:hypothetical protein SM033_00098 [Vibrio phage vB_VpaM_sm033]